MSNADNFIFSYGICDWQELLQEQWWLLATNKVSVMSKNVVASSHERQVKRTNCNDN